MRGAAAALPGASRRHFLKLMGAAGAVAAATSASGSVLTGCSSGSGSTDTLKVGVMAPFSGVGQFMGSVVNDSLTAATKHMNATGGVHGRKVELFLRDTAADAATTARVYGELAAIKDLLGILCCGVVGFASILPRVRQDGLPVVAVFLDPLSAGQLYPQGSATGRSVFQMSVPDAYVMAALADYAKNDRGYSSAGLIYDHSLDAEFDQPNATRTRFEQAFTHVGLTVGAVETFTSGAAHFDAQIQALKRAAPQVVYMDGLSDDTATITTALAATGAAYVDTPTAKGPGWHPHVFGAYQGINDVWAQLAGEAAKVGSVSAWHLGGITFLPSYAIRSWMHTYVGKDPDGGEELVADGLATIINGLEKAGTSDRRRLVRGIESMGPVTFATTPFEFTADRHTAVTPDDVTLLTLERLRGPAPTDPPYKLGIEWQEGGAYANRGASTTLLVRPTLAANRRADADVMAEILHKGYGTQCTKLPDGSLVPECKIH